jgi:hypothetical protein
MHMVVFESWILVPDSKCSGHSMVSKTSTVRKRGPDVRILGLLPCVL